MLFTPIRPMDAVMGASAFDDERFLFDIKWDGWRMILHKDGPRVEAFTKRGNRITDNFPELKEWANSITSWRAVLDCEVVCLRADGRPSFDDISYRGRIGKPDRIAAAVRSHPATLIPFDLLLSDKDHTSEPLIDRKSRLQELIKPTSSVMPTLFLDGKGKALSELTRKRNLEGIMAKHKESIYRYSVSSQKNTRSSDWIKIKNFQIADTIILGYQINPFAIIVGMHFPTVKFKPVAKVESGFSSEEIRTFLKDAKGMHKRKTGKTQWIEPNLCCQIQYLDRTDNHHLRITSFKGFLHAKNPDSCLWTA